VRADDIVLLHPDPDRDRSAEVTVVRGVSVAEPDWAALSRLERRRLVVRAHLATLRIGAVVSHRSAATLWGFPDHDPDDGRLHVIDPARRHTTPDRA
jgi:hypothetical protein